MKKLLLFTLLYITALQLEAQQYPLFTKYVLNDFGFNPAIAGTSDYLETRLTYRTQWVGIDDSPKTSILSAHGGLDSIPIGIGGYIFNDVAGQIKRTGFSLGGSYGIDLDVGELRLGVSGTFYNYRLNENFFAEDLNDMSLMSATDGKWTPDLNIGIYFKMENGLYVGASAPQILNRDIRFENDNTNMDITTDFLPHYYAMAGYRLSVSEKLAVEPSILFKITEAAPVQVDVSARAIFNDKFWLGASYRTEDAGALMIGYDLSRRMNVAYAYDFTLSDLREGSSGSHEITLGLRLFGPKDSDGDGIMDKDDACPEKPGKEENNGCPEDEQAMKIKDTDKDGILDPNDDCVEEPGPKDNNGCPYGDRDKDGVRDEIDDCPEVPGAAIDKGCPKGDSDGDGILDTADRCPKVRGHIQNQGCPLGDSDGDGILDEDDKCPNTAGGIGRGGCPNATPEEMEILELVIKNLYFDTDKDKIRQGAYPYLDRLAELLVRRPELKVGMRGHTDERGSDEYNLDLSKRRVEAALFYLMNRGVSRSQLLTEYYGERIPAAPNQPETYQLNRRVEMQFVWD